MESAEVTIARLVLGYLKNECRGAYKEFLRSSAHLHHKNLRKNKYLPTRFVGLNLEEILREYFGIYQIVQGRLEATNYFNESHRRISLFSQLLYLFNRGHESRNSTPCPSLRSPAQSQIDDASPSYIEQISDVEATPAHSLPGNVLYSEEESIRNTKNDKTKCIDNEVCQAGVDTEILAQTLLENKEFQEKIAQTINKVAEKQHRVSAELNQTIETVVKETEEDPMFDKILDEIIGSAAAASGNIGRTESTSMSSSTSHNSKKENSTSSTQKKLDSIVEECLQQTHDPITVQNDEAIRSIVCNSNPTEQTVVNSEVILFDGPLDKYLIQNTNVTSNLNVLNPPCINTTGLLIPTSGLQVEQFRQPSYVLNYQQLQTVPWKVSSLVSERDILTMPTVIVTENKSKGKQNSKTSKSPLSKSRQKQIAPAPIISIMNDTQRTDSESTAEQQGLKNVIYPKATSCTSIVTETITKSRPLCTSTPAPTKILANLTIGESEPERQETLPSTENIQKITSKSSSHVRNLNFSTPPKIMLPKENKPKQAMKTLLTERKTLKKEKTWDSDLRATLLTQSDTQQKSDTPKRKKRPIEKKKRTKSKKSKLNTTDQDAVLIEAALKSPKDNKTILSPSKLNASKRNLNTENKDKFITPENIKESDIHSIKSNRNITPMLETPAKNIPNTPGDSIPIDCSTSTLTPFTKMLEANLKGIDICQIPTPNIPITPNFPPLTPNITPTCSNRPTDYSTSSSYYQPSDNEQNKSLEQQLKELEKPLLEAKKTIDEHLSVFNKSIIGKKNLNLVKRNMPSSSSSSDEASSIGEEDNTSVESHNKESNNTVIFKNAPASPARTYSLRNRNITAKETKIVTFVKHKKPRVKNCNKENNKKIEDESKEESNSSNYFQKDLEEKRLRMVNLVKKKDENNDVKKSKMRSLKTKPIANVTCNSKRKSRKSVSPKKFANKIDEMRDLLMEDLFDSEEDPDTTKPKPTEINDVSASDVEAQNLIEGLKERGIHLMHIKTPKKGTVKNDSLDSNEQSSFKLEKEMREEYDTKVFEQEDIHIVFDETTEIKQYDGSNRVDFEKKTVMGKVYVEEIDREMDVLLRYTSFSLLLDLPAGTAEKPAESVKKTVSDGETPQLKREEASTLLKDSSHTEESRIDELMNFAVLGVDSEDMVDGSNLKKRKQRSGEDTHSENTLLKKLKKLEVDSLLNVIHGSNKK